MSAHPDGAAERLERLLGGAPPRDDTDRETVALLAAIREAEPPAPEALRARIATLGADGARPTSWRHRLAPRRTASRGTPRRRGLWIAAPVAAAALAAAVVVPTVMRDGSPEPRAASSAADTAATDSGAEADPTAPMVAPEAAPASAAPARAGQPAGGSLRVRVADRAALAGAAARAVAAVDALGGRRVAGRTTPRAGERRIVLVARVPAARVDDALAALGALGAVTAQRRPDPAATASDALVLRVVFEAPVG